MGRSPSGGGGEFDIAFVNGPIKFLSDEGILYSRLFHIVDTDADGYIGGTEGAAFIRRARLMNDANREIWRLSSGGKSQEKLNKDCWFVAMKLVALVQSTGKCQMQSLYSGEPLPLADFQLEQPVDNVLPEEATPEFKRSFEVSNEVCSHEKLSQTLELQIVLTASTEIGQHIDEYEKRIREVTRCSDIVYAAQRSEGYELSRFGSYLSALSQHEKRDRDMKQLAEVAGDHFETVSNIYQDQVHTYQAGKVDAVKTVMSNRESAIHEVQQANASMQRNKERFAAARASSGAAASAMRAEQKMASAEDRMNQAQEQVQFIANSLKVETKRMDTGKTANLKTALLSLANLELDYHVQSRAAWEGLRSFLELSDEEVAASEESARTPVTYRKPGEKDLGQIIGLL
ncbi:hypothetical protein BBO99_00001846 [Phytophthora kernoviae]|uniref:Sorting nexin/Vps5-like C-terminal domain-containing protein n=2 Tax=Phytophthora kernoviae TaxID=325452 RepID=A0A3R7JXM4_9STRA|nr:hypothetical protein G195_001784 [Phytophthora kernoviae 00238/432]KAG2531036.1 hypothetical protein JM16_001355 [Phytophthora kernoviae]KAG2531596.1 hypothetical protein JM18_001625 [Phytophthora kernoviae]RLN31791.1 hypothetical protein BBI17_001620 [Phytophthora kernoviae]RLN83731.1 hypothetical protein BBO99_00001846 [Phytophthora kernoviae]